MLKLEIHCLYRQQRSITGTTVLISIDMDDVIQRAIDDRLEISFSIRERNIESMVKTFSRLRNEANLRILMFLATGDSKIEKIHRLMSKKGLHTYRESTYKALERLREVGLVDKTYDPKEKTFTYSLVSTTGN